MRTSRLLDVDQAAIHLTHAGASQRQDADVVDALLLRLLHLGVVGGLEVLEPAAAAQDTLRG